MAESTTETGRLTTSRVENSVASLIVSAKIRPLFSSALTLSPNGIDILSNFGLAILISLVTNVVSGSLLHLHGKQQDWAMYLPFGTIIPAAVIGLLLLEKPSGHQVAPIRGARLALAAGGLAACLYIAVSSRSHYLLLFAALQIALVERIFRKRSLRLDIPTLVAGFGLLSVAWVSATELLWWQPYDEWILGSNYTFLVFVGSFAVAVTALLCQSAGSEQPDPQLSRVDGPLGIVIASMIIGMACTNTAPSFAQLVSKFHHWGVYVGPAELVRQGGWLLWDVPSQYGLLSVLAIALLPVKSVWESFYILDALVLFSSAFFIFLAIRRLGAGNVHFVFSLIAAVASVFLTGGWAPSLYSPSVTPSVGAFRFIWCYIIVGILAWGLNDRRGAYSGRLTVVIGTIAWLAGTFWSAESAIFCAVSWLPSFAIIVTRRATHRSASGSDRICLRNLAGWLIAPPILLAGVTSAITAYYELRLGHGPDWRAYFDYSLSFSTGFRPGSIDLHGPVICLLLIYILLAAIISHLIRTKLTHDAVPIMVSILGVLWSTSSYYVAESDIPNVVRLIPIAFAVLGVALCVDARYLRSDSFNMLVRMTIAPIFVVIFSMALGNPSAVGNFLFAHQTSYAGDVATELPVMDDSLRHLFEEAQVGMSDPVVFYDPVPSTANDPGLNMLPSWPNRGLGNTMRAWLPTVPFAAFIPLPPDRSQIYVARFIVRHKLSGWLIQRKEHPYTSIRWLALPLSQSYVPTKEYESGDWQIIWFQYDATRSRSSQTGQ